ncbi:MAG: DUF4215 domain-containing protein, partial [Patescibacteria group bacterium]
MTHITPRTYSLALAFAASAISLFTVITVGGVEYAGALRRNSAAPPALCGDNVVVAPEECEDGNLRDGDGCSHRCQREYCGDGKISRYEQCDDRNGWDNDGCSANCKREYCGDGILQKNE